MGYGILGGFRPLNPGFTWSGCDLQQPVHERLGLRETVCKLYIAHLSMVKVDMEFLSRLKAVPESIIARLIPQALCYCFHLTVSVVVVAAPLGNSYQRMSRRTPQLFRPLQNIPGIKLPVRFRQK